MAKVGEYDITNKQIISTIVVLTVMMSGGHYLTSSNFQSFIESNPEAKYIIIDNLWYDSNTHQIHILTPEGDSLAQQADKTGMGVLIYKYEIDYSASSIKKYVVMMTLWVGDNR